MPSPSKRRAAASSSISSSSTSTTRPIAGPSSPSSKKSPKTPPVPPIPIDKRTSSANVLRSSPYYSHAQQQHASATPSTPSSRTYRPVDGRGEYSQRAIPGEQTVISGDRLSQEHDYYYNDDDDNEYYDERDPDQARPKVSHELSLSAGTRDSLVDNLLFSLDSLSRGGNDEAGGSRYGGGLDALERERIRALEFDYEKYSVPRDLPPFGTPIGGSGGSGGGSGGKRRERSHTHSSSLSSTFGTHTLPDSSSFDSSSTIGAAAGQHRATTQHDAAAAEQSTAMSWLADSSPGPTPSGGSGNNARRSMDREPSAAFGGFDSNNNIRNSEQRSSRPAWKRRSVSVDQLFAEAAAAGLASPTYTSSSSLSGGGGGGGRAGAHSILDRGRPVPSMFSKYEAQLYAAPEPNVANGPRTQQNPEAYGPVYVNFAPRGHSTLRKTTTQSDLRSSASNNNINRDNNTSSNSLFSGFGLGLGLGHSPSVPNDIRSQAGNFVRASSIRGNPALGSGQGSTDAGGGHTATAAHNAQHAKPTSTREKPGFFRRVFGGGGGGAGAARPGSKDASANASSPKRADAVTQPVTQPMQHQETQQQQQQTAPLPRASSSRGMPTRSESRPELSSSTSIKRDHGPTGNMINGGGSSTKGISHPPVSLNKKPSSFFRRRKKSTSEQLQPPVPQIPLNSNINNNVDNHIDGAAPAVQGAAPSPSISSLRKVMGAYLDGAADDIDDENNENNISNTSRNLTTPSADRPPTGQSSASACEDSDNLDIFHSGYTPPMDASLGFRNPISRSPTVRAAKNSLEQQDWNGSPTKMKVKVRKGSATAHSAAESRDEMDRLGLHSRASSGERIIAAHTAGAPRASAGAGDEGLGITARAVTAEERPESKKSDRVVLRPSASEEHIVINTGAARAESAMSGKQSSNGAFVSALNSPITPSSIMDFQSATSLSIPSGRQSALKSPITSIEVNGTPVLASSAEEEDPKAAEYRERALKIFNGDSDDVSKLDAASWLGDTSVLSTNTRRAYMSLFDFAGVNMLAALRMLCGRLVLRGETQQFDRIITALATRWCECNPHHGFKSQDVVHTILYSLILLNTDLHLADISEKMSRSAYVKNTLPTVRRVVADAAMDETIRPMAPPARPTLPWSDSSHSVAASAASPTLGSERPSFDSNRVAAPTTIGKRLSVRPTFPRNDSDAGDGASELLNALVNVPSTAGTKGWEAEIEAVLKAFFNSIKNEPLPLSRPSAPESAERSLSAAGGTTANNGHSNVIRRAGSIISKAPSDTASHRTKGTFRSMTMGLQGKYSRSSKPSKFYSASTLGSSSRTSFNDGDSSFWSPAQSSAFSSKYSFGNNRGGGTLTSASMQSLGGASYPRSADFKHSIGFANALSQAIIREEAATAAAAAAADNDGESVSVPTHGLLEDGALALEGAPWAKEGLVKHKHHLEAAGKRAKERSWTDCFAVISTGKLTLFAFGTGGSSASHHGPRSAAASLGRRALSRPSTAGNHHNSRSSAAGGTVGGGDWMENAEQLDVFILRQTIASVLPPPGYSKTRPHVWALSLPSGAVHLFQVGTPEIAGEFIETANYWSARLSKEPLVGAVSNIEYGWSDEVLGSATAAAANNNNPAGARENAVGRASSSSFSTAIAGGGRQPRHQHHRSASTATATAINAPVPVVKSRSANHMHNPSTTSSITSMTGAGAGAARPSFQSASARGTTSFESALGGFAGSIVSGTSGGVGGARGTHASLPGDKITIVEWHPPTQSLMPSQLMEVDQLRALSAYVAAQEEELERHGELKAGLSAVYSPRSANHSRALANWQRKSDHLLREIVKFRTYIDSLNAAQVAKDEFYRKKESTATTAGATAPPTATAAGA